MPVQETLNTQYEFQNVVTAETHQETQELTPAGQLSFDNLSSEQGTFGFYYLQNCGTPSRENDDLFGIQ